jgi:hypothetical protein
VVRSSAKTVPEYIAALPVAQQRVVRQLRAFVRKHLPKGYKEAIDWGVITYAVPLTTLPDTYNGRPLCYAAIAAKKKAYTIYLMAPYGNPAQKKWMAEEFKKRGKKLNMGGSCLHLKSLDDIPLDVVGKVIASVPVDKYIAHYRETRKKTAKGK